MIGRRQAQASGLAAIMVLATSATAAAQTVAYQYDGVGRLRSATYADGRQISYTYDAAGNRMERVVSGEDQTPSAFDLGTAITNGVAGQYYSSSIVTLSGFNVPAPLQIAGGQYRIDGGAWVSAASAVEVGQTVQVRVQAPPSGGATGTATLTIGGVADGFSVTTAIDTTPNPFDLGGPVGGATAGAWSMSAAITVSGINAAAPVTVAGGQYRVNGGAWRATPGTVVNGQILQVQAQASSTPGATQTAALSVGGVTDTFQVITGDVVPNAFDLGPPVTGASAGSWQTSTTIVVGGVTAPSPISITGGQYRVNGGAWTSAAGAVLDGQTVQVRAQAPAAGNTIQTATLTIGGISDVFVVETAADSIPNAFDLGGPVTGASGSFQLSNTVTITGINIPAPVAIAGGQVRIAGGAWGSTVTSIVSGQTLQVRAQAPAAGGAGQTATVTVGGITDAFQVTALVDQAPNAFAFQPVSGAARNTVVAHPAGVRAVTGINAATPVSIAGGSYRISGGAWRTAPATVTLDDTVDVRLTTGGDYNTAYAAILTVGSYSTPFTVTTQTAPDYTPDPLDWTDLSPFFAGQASGPDGPKYVDGPTRTIMGLGAGLSITLNFAQDAISPGNAGLTVVVYKNGLALSPRSLSIADGSGYSRGPTGLTVSLTNGDTIRFRAEVHDSAIPPGAGADSDREARQVIINQTTGAQIDTFVVRGFYSEETNCGGQAC